MAGTIRPNELNASTTPLLASKTLPGLDIKTELQKKPTIPRAPRIDVEPLYTAVKGAISDADWQTYKTSLSSFLLGNLNQEELSWRLGRILTTPALEHAHNQFMLGIYANIWRDAPEAGIASWVSSSDKPSSGVAKGTGDESEKRLKHEIMQLSRRERKRLKTVHQGDRAGGNATADGAGQGLGDELLGMGPIRELVEGKRAKQPEMGPIQSGGQGGYQKTNWDLEIRKRYTSSLFTETHEFPTSLTISHRLLPICYEFGLPQGHTQDCPEYLNIATETYIKEALTNFFQLVSSNGPGFVRTADFKKRVEKEERLVDRGELQRGQGGELPIEQEERRKRKLLCMEDLRLALELGDSYLGQVPLISGSIVNNRFLDTDGMEDIYVHENLSKPLANGLPNGVIVNGINRTANTNDLINGTGWNIDLGDPMVLDDDLGAPWQGGSVQDITELDTGLDELLNFTEI